MDIGAAKLAMSERRDGDGDGDDGVGALLRTHGEVLGRLAMALVGDGAEAERVLETAARQAGAEGGKPKAGQSPLAWLCGLVRTASATHLSRLPLRATRGPGGSDNAPGTERLGAAAAMPARQALAALRPTEREAVVLSLVAGLSLDDVASATGVDVATAKTRLARGLEQLMRDAGGAK
jgi:RNA polymerase sigma-70 factor (ECF subfamily)